MYNRIIISTIGQPGPIMLADGPEKGKRMQKELELEEILKQLYKLSGLLIDVYDLEGKLIARYPDKGAPFCTLVGKTAGGRRKCTSNNQQAFAAVRKEHKVYIYQCHMGLYEAVFPLYHYGRLAGYMMTGQMLENREGAEEELCKKAERLHIGGREEIQETAAQLVRIAPQEMETFATMCRICADYIANHHQFPVTAAGTARELVRYLEEHFRERITLDHLCRWFGYSRTRLEQLFRAYTGSSIGRYLTEVRIRQACRLLRGTSLSIYSVAMETGFSSQNYFSRQFRKYTGCTPVSYRRQAGGESDQPDIESINK